MLVPQVAPETRQSLQVVDFSEGVMVRVDPSATCLAEQMRSRGGTYFRDIDALIPTC